MSVSTASRRVFPILSLSVLIAANAFAQAATQETYTPQVGQEGKDVVWVPTSQTVVDKMLEMAKLTSSDYLMDLGSGDGRTVITAAKRGARALGIEYNPKMVELSKENAAKANVTAKAQFKEADLFTTDFSEATVITMFLLPSINMKLRPTILNLKPGTRIVSNTFTMEDWEADETATVSGDCTSYCTPLLWIVPAKVEGTWQGPQGTFAMTQKFQKVFGTMGSAQISGGSLRGDQITFKVGDAQYTGKVSGNGITGTMTSGGKSTPWSVSRRPS